MNGSLVDAIVDRVRTMPGETMVAIDPDGLVRSLAVLDALCTKTVDVVAWEEPLQSRLDWERPTPSGGRVVIVDQPYRADVLPADVLSVATRRVMVSADDHFAPLDRSIVVQLDWADREAAFAIAAGLPGKSLDASQTASLLLRRLYRLDPEVMTQPHALMEVPLRYHRSMRAAPISASLAAVFAEAVGDPLPGLMTSDAVVDKGSFLIWLQAGWDAAATDAEAGVMRSLLLADGPAQLLDDYFDVRSSSGGRLCGRREVAIRRHHRRGCRDETSCGAALLPLARLSMPGRLPTMGGELSRNVGPTCWLPNTRLWLSQAQISRHSVSG